ncbi:MAG: transcriptional regulator MraZ [Solirubrobacteraceae bacterium]|nr:transcriptional regulator MraZ [Solirubrobacteraceae bacterium]
MFFQGINDHSLDAKNRLTVPSKARALLANGVTVAMGFEKCLTVYPAADYQDIAKAALAGLNPMSSAARDLKRHLYGNAITVDLDSAGRIAIPPKYAAHAGITKEVTVVGAGECLELWEPASYDTKNADLIQRAADHIENIGDPA